MGALCHVYFLMVFSSLAHINSIGLAAEEVQIIENFHQILDFK